MRLGGDSWYHLQPEQSVAGPNSDVGTGPSIDSFRSLISVIIPGMLLTQSAFSFPNIPHKFMRYREPR